MSKYTIVFLTVLMCMFGIYNFTTDIGVTSNIKNTQYANYLTTATHDAAKEMSSEATNSITLPTQSDRARVVNTFYRSLMMDFNYTTQEDEQKLHAYVPVIAMIDTNGYYICYNENYKESTGVTMRSVITTINTWTKTVQDGSVTYLIRYYLGHNVDVTVIPASGEQKTYSGSYGEVYQKLGSPSVLKDLGFDSTEAANRGTADTDAKFEKYQRAVIIPDIQQKIEYYINNHNKVATSYATNYTFEMPQTSNDDWVRLIQNPTVIAFLQGVRVSNTQDYLNIYSLGGGEVKKQNFTTYTTDAGGNTTYTEGSSAGAGGYVPGSNAAAQNGGTAQDNTSKTKATVSHVHVGNPNTYGGCYTVPVFHTHDSSCYTVVDHVHYNRLGIAVPDSYMLDTNRLGETPLTARDAKGNKIYVDDGTAESKEIQTCYTVPVYHQHTDDCYEIIYHHHTGNPTTGGRCYGEAVYHQHTAACYSNATTTTYTLTKNIYHKHTYPVIHYGRLSDPTFDTEDADEAGQYTDAYQMYAATDDTCYQATYSNVTLTWNVRRINLHTGISDNITLQTYNNEGATQVYTAVSKKGDQRVWFDDDYEYIGTLANDVPAPTTTHDWDNSVDSIGNRKWKFMQVDQEPICGMTEETIVGTEPILDKNGNPMTFTTTKPGKLICGKTTDTVEYYRPNCGYTDLWNMSDVDKQAYVKNQTTYSWDGTAKVTVLDTKTGNATDKTTTTDVTDFQTGDSSNATYGIKNTNIGDTATFTVYYDSNMNNLSVDSIKDSGVPKDANGDYALFKYEYTVKLSSKSSFRDEFTNRSIEGKRLLCGYDTEEKLKTPIGYKRSCGLATGDIDHTYLSCGKLDEDEINAKLASFTTTEEKNSFIASDQYKKSIAKYSIGCGFYEGQEITEDQQKALEATVK